MTIEQASFRLEALAEVCRNATQDKKKKTIPVGVLDFIAGQIDNALRELKE